MTAAVVMVAERMTEEEASSLTTRISVKLDTIADNYESVMPLLREAITRQAHVALGYASAGAYIGDRFGNALSRLGTDVRREVVRELSGAGLSTRAIAPVVGVSQKTVVQDRKTSGDTSGITSASRRPSPDERSGVVDAPREPDALDLQHAPSAPEEPPASEPEAVAPTVIGTDGKTYAAKATRTAPYRKPLPDVAKTAAPSRSPPRAGAAPPCASPSTERI